MSPAPCFHLGNNPETIVMGRMVAREGKSDEPRIRTVAIYALAQVSEDWHHTVRGIFKASSPEHPTISLA
jgi:hypothetical protein